MDVAVAGGYAYVAASTAGLDVIDTSNPAAPVRVGGFDTSGSAEKVAIAGSYAYVADYDGGLVILHFGPDCNTNGHIDDGDIASGTSTDCNANGSPDECENIANGDFNASGTVELSDFSAFVNCMAGPGVPPTPSVAVCSGACLVAFDTEPDGDIDATDFAAFQAAFTGG